ncbi:KilA-N domain-containing protein [Chryseobacterium sediminis]|uniref:KilA-N domain-containing protein n=1 Tax=Chryseobacterium sediminis TaxID=1679494 RepID=A0A5B2U9M7_9FLAO|nr:KilA-N domain-containing protein [Chryseobacterium sediminis]KAA2223028.1 KilA-N domain-containing protein [Chryseobacterium sediminis]
MKTNQILTRPMGGFNVSQRTVDGMFNATELLKQWNDHSCQKREIKKFFENDSTKQFLNALIKEENLKGENSAYLKSRGKYSGGTWMHPLLFIDFAMWLNPAFKVKVLKFVYDQLIKYRNEAGDTYKDLSNAVAKLVPKEKIAVSMKEVATGINFCVFGSHERNIRNKKAEESLMIELVETQKKLTMLINEEFLNSYEEVINYLRKSRKNKAKRLVLQN